MLSDWFDDWSEDHPVQVMFGDGTGPLYLSIDAAVNRLDFIDKEKGRAGILNGNGFRSHSGAIYKLWKTQPVEP